MLWTWAYWRTVTERAAGASCGVLLARLGGGDLMGVDVLLVDWSTALSFAAGAALVVVLGSVVASGFSAGGKGVPMWAAPPTPQPGRKRPVPESVPPRLRPPRPPR